MQRLRIVLQNYENQLDYDIVDIANQLNLSTALYCLLNLDKHKKSIKIFKPCVVEGNTLISMVNTTNIN